MDAGVVVSAIVVNHDGRGFVEEAVESLLAQDASGLEVLVVDNASSDGSDRLLADHFGARIRLLRAGRNLGFGGGCNLAIRASRGRYLLLLNPDAVAGPGFARELVAVAEADSRLGMVAAKVLAYGTRDRIDTVGQLVTCDGLGRGRGRLEVDRGQYDGEREALVPSGAAGLYRRAMLDEIGLFDEEFFLYADDTELGLRGRLLGWGCALAPAAVAWHRYSQGVGAYSSLKAFYVERNRVWLLLKLFPLRLVVWSPLATIARLGLQAWGALTGRGAAARLAAERSLPHLAAVTLRAYASALRGLPRALSERRKLARRRRLPTGEWLALLRRFRLPLREAALKD